MDSTNHPGLPMRLAHIVYEGCFYPYYLKPIVLKALS